MKKMGLPKVGMITFSDAREHEYKVLYEEKTAARIKRTVEYFADYEMELHTFDTVARSPQDIDRQTDELKKKGVEVFIANIPVSYTHLDVYKRQVLIRAHSFNRIRPHLMQMHAGYPTRSSEAERCLNSGVSCGAPGL